MTTTKPFQGAFLFINKDPNNFNDRDPAEAYAIGSHVAGTYTKWSKIARLRTGEAAKSQLLSTTSIQKTSNTEPVEHDGSAPCTIGSAPGVTYDRQASVSRRKTARSLATTPNDALWPWARRTHTNPLNLMQHGNSDPFSASSIEITPLNHFLITSWQSIFMQTVFPSEIIQKVSASNMTCCEEGAGMIGSPERLHFQLAWSLTLLLSSMPASSTKKTFEVEALRHKAQGLNGFRKNLPTMVKVTAIRAIWHLMGVEYYSGDIVAAFTHFRAMVALINSIGGLRTLPWDLRKLVIVSDMTISHAGKTHSGFDVAEYDPGPVRRILLPTEACILASSPTMQQRFHENIPICLLDIFTSYRELLAVREIAVVMPDTARLTALLLWAQMRQYALSTRVTNLKAYLATLPTSIENFLCVAVDYFTQILWLGNHYQKAAYAPLHYSEGSFETLGVVSQLEKSPLTLWIVFIAATVELIMRTRGQVETAFLTEFATMLETLQIHTLEDVRQVLSQFLYQDEPFDQYLYVLCCQMSLSETNSAIANTTANTSDLAPA